MAACPFARASRPDFRADLASGGIGPLDAGRRVALGLAGERRRGAVWPCPQRWARKVRDRARRRQPAKGRHFRKAGRRNLDQDRRRRFGTPGEKLAQPGKKGAPKRPSKTPQIAGRYCACPELRLVLTASKRVPCLIERRPKLVVPHRERGFVRVLYVELDRRSAGLAEWLTLRRSVAAAAQRITCRIRATALMPIKPGGAANCRALAMTASIAARACRSRDRCGIEARRIQGLVPFINYRA
jgi:hypothetical protein